LHLFTRHIGRGSQCQSKDGRNLQFDAERTLELQSKKQRLLEKPDQDRFFQIRQAQRMSAD